MRCDAPRAPQPFKEPGNAKTIYGGIVANRVPVLLLEVATVASSNSSPPLRGSGPTATSGQPSSAARGTTRAKWKPRHRHRRHRHHQPRSCRRYRCRPTAPIAVAAPLWHVLVWCSWLRRTGPRLRPQAAKSPARWAFFRWWLRNASVGVGWAGQERICAHLTSLLPYLAAGSEGQ